MALRLEEQTFQVWKRVLQDFLPTYIENDANLPSEYHYKFGFNTWIFSPMTTWEYWWSDIKYSNERLDFDRIKLHFSALGGG